MVLYFVSSSIALLCLGLAPDAARLVDQRDALAQSRTARALEPDVDAAVAAALRAFEGAVFLRSAPRDARLLVRPDVEGDGVDPVRTLLAAERFAQRLAGRGGAVELDSEKTGPSTSAAACIELGVAPDGAAFSLSLRDAEGTELLGAQGVCIAFVEKPWVRGAVPAMPRFAHVVRGEGFATNVEDARRAAHDAALSRLRELVPDRSQALVPEDSALTSGGWSERLERCTIDRFESAGSAGEPARCAVLIGLTTADLEHFEAEAARARRAATLAFSAKGGAGCLWLALCVMLCARADLATRGYLTWTWRGLFTLVFAAGIAAVATWS